MAARHEVGPSTKMTSLTALDGLALKERIAAYIVVVFSQQVTHAVIKKREINYNTQYSALSMTRCVAWHFIYATICTYSCTAQSPPTFSLYKR